MADRTVTVKPSGGDYTTLAAAIAGEVASNPDLTSDNGSGGAGILIIEISGDWDGSPFTGKVTINGFTTSTDYYIKLTTDSANRARKDAWDTSRAMIQVAGDSAIEAWDNHIWIDGLQFNSGDDNVEVGNVAAGSWTKISNCRFNSAEYGMYISDSDANVIAYNNIFNGGQRAAYVGGGSLIFYNNVVYGSVADGIEFQSGTTGIVKNNAIFNNADDIDDEGTVTIDYNASDDGDGTNAVAPSGSDWDNEFIAPATGDFTLLNTGNLYDAGIGPASDANVPTTDIDGDTRSGATCDIGADEYVAAGGISIPVVMHHMKMQGGL